uniref:T-box domain-containing protein n=1 Tax=Caenorhabditis japonica TaxID=281687 RepID=A0A8R1E2Z4_CAEJA
MMNPICFDRVKITNNAEKNNASLIFLHSMHKYVPVLSIYESPSESPFSVPQTSDRLVSSTKIPYTEFIAVTAYQNQSIISLKIEHNPFAKGFREGSQTERKRRSPSAESTTEESQSQISSPQPKKQRSVSSSPPIISPFAAPPMFPPTPINPLFFTLPYFSHLAANGANMPPQFPFPFGFPCFSPQFPFQPQQSAKQQELPELTKQEPEEEVHVV